MSVTRRLYMIPPPNAHAILGHYYHSGTGPRAQGDVSIPEWEAGLDAYGSRLCPAQDWIDRALSGKQLDEVCVSFDDGLREAYVLALPSLEKRGLTAWWGIYTGPYVGVPNSLERYRWLRNFGFGGMEQFYTMARALVRYQSAPFDYLGAKAYLTQEDRDFRFWRNTCPPTVYEEVMETLMFDATVTPPLSFWMTEEDIALLYKKGHVIGFHTHSHPTDMRRLTLEAQCLEYATSRAIVGLILSAVSASPVRTMAHPCDTYTPEGLDWLRAQGIQIGWGGDVTSTDLLRAPRYSTGFWRL